MTSALLQLVLSETKISWTPSVSILWNYVTCCFQLNQGDSDTGGRGMLWWLLSWLMQNNMPLNVHLDLWCPCSSGQNVTEQWTWKWRRYWDLHWVTFRCSPVKGSSYWLLLSGFSQANLVFWGDEKGKWWWEIPNERTKCKNLLIIVHHGKICRDGFVFCPHMW